MRARELAAEYPTVTPDHSALEAARLLAGQRLPGLVVVDLLGDPRTPLPAVGSGATAMGNASVKMRARSPVVAAADDERHPERGAVIGVITTAPGTGAAGPGGDA